MKKILITGGAGFIGGSLARALCKDQENQVVVDNLITGSKSKIPKFSNCSFYKCDVNKYKDIAPIMTSYGFDYVFHYAALVGVRRTLENPIAVLHDIQGIKNLLDLSKSTGVKRIFYSSPSEVYGEPVELPQRELTTPLNSRLPYAVVKNVGEAFCRSYYEEYGLNYTIFRFFNTYGPLQSRDFVISKFLNAALINKPITVYGDGLQSRTFCHIDDNVAATLAILYENLMVNEIINIGNDRAYTILELAQIIIELTNSKSTIEYLTPLAEGDMSRRQPEISKMNGILNRTLVTLEQGLRLIIKGNQPIY